MIFNVFVAFNHFNMAIRMNNVLVDYLLPWIALAGVAGVYKMRHDLKASSTYIFIVVSALSLVKSSASFLAVLILIYYLYESFKNPYEQ